jgi:hypothetical protein
MTARDWVDVINESGMLLRVQRWRLPAVYLETYRLKYILLKRITLKCDLVKNTG